MNSLTRTVQVQNNLIKIILFECMLQTLKFLFESILVFFRVLSSKVRLLYGSMSAHTFITVGSLSIHHWIVDHSLAISRISSISIGFCISEQNGPCGLIWTAGVPSGNSGSSSHSKGPAINVGCLVCLTAATFFHCSCQRRAVSGGNRWVDNQRTFGRSTGGNSGSSLIQSVHSFVCFHSSNKCLKPSAGFANVLISRELVDISSAVVDCGTETC